MALENVGRELIDWLDSSKYVDPVHTLFHNIWIGPKNTIQTMHKDNHDNILLNKNLFVQISGYKYVLLVDDRFLFDVHPSFCSSHLRHHIAVDPLSSEFLDLLPPDAKIRSTLLGPGDLLFIPENTWHYVQSVTPSISLSIWWFANPLCEIIYRASKCRSPSELAECRRKLRRPLHNEHFAPFDAVGGLLKYINGLQPALRAAIVECILESGV